MLAVVVGFTLSILIGVNKQAQCVLAGFIDGVRSNNMLRGNEDRVMLGKDRQKGPGRAGLRPISDVSSGQGTGHGHAPAGPFLGRGEAAPQEPGRVPDAGQAST